MVRVATLSTPPRWRGFSAAPASAPTPRANLRWWGFPKRWRRSSSRTALASVFFAPAGLPPASAKAADGAPPPKGPLAEQFAELIRNGMAPSDVAELVLKGIKDNELYIFTHAEMRPWLEKRVDRCLVAYRKLGPAPQEIMG